MIKLGGHVFPSAEQNAKDPELLAHLAKQMGYQAAYAPDYLTKMCIRDRCYYDG